VIDSAAALPRLFREAAAELRRRVIAGEHKQVMERGNGFTETHRRQALIQPMK
jgi:hypothetical protein